MLMRNNDPYQKDTLTLVLKWYAWHNTLLNNLIWRIYFAALVMFYVVNFSQF